MDTAIAIGIDTHSFVKKLTTAGFTEQQAEAQSDTINKVFTDFQNKNLEVLATKGDLIRIEGKIEKVEIELKSEIKLLKWMLGFTLAGVMGIFMTLIRMSVL